MQRLQGWSEKGNTFVSVSGITATTKPVQGSYPLSTITVYLSGTTTLVSIYSDNSLTPKANPFTCAADGSWFLYAADGRYDVKFSGTGVTVPFTLGDFELMESNVGLNGATYILSQMASDFVSVKRYGALGNGVRVQDAAMTATLTVLTSATANFLNSTVANGGDIGKLIVVEGAGPSSNTLLASILSVNSSTSVTLSVAATTTVSGVQAIWASDDTAAINAALAANYCVYLPIGIYGITALRLRQGNRMVGSSIDLSALSRMGAGVGGPAIGMTTDEAAQKISITDLTLYANNIGSNNDGINLGTQGNAYAFANGSWLNNLRVCSASGYNFKINSNAGCFGQLWSQSAPTLGTPLALSRPNSGGFYCDDTTMYGLLLNVEGYFELPPVVLNSGGGCIVNLQIETGGAFASRPLVSVGNSGQSILNTFVHASGSCSDIFDIVNGTQAVEIRNVFIELAPTATNIINDHQNGIAIPIAGRSGIPYYYSDFANTVSYDDTTLQRIGKMLLMAGVIQMPNAVGIYALNNAGLAYKRMVVLDSLDNILLGQSGVGTAIIGNVGFYGETPISRPTVTGSRGGNAALASLLTALAAQGLIVNSSS